MSNLIRRLVCFLKWHKRHPLFGCRKCNPYFDKEIIKVMDALSNEIASKPRGNYVVIVPVDHD